MTCAVVQRSPYGFHTASSCFWDTTSDGKRLCMCMVSHFSPVRLFVTPWTVAHRVPLSTGFPRQEYWSGLPFPSPGDLPAPGTEPASPALAGRLSPTEPPEKSKPTGTAQINDDTPAGLPLLKHRSDTEMTLFFLSCTPPRSPAHTLLRITGG